VSVWRWCTVGISFRVFVVWGRCKHRRGGHSHCCRVVLLLRAGW
jgi:hypothetical protein